MRVLGIETTCDETAAAVVSDHLGGEGGEILSNEVLSQIAQHAAYGGVVPEIAARAHIDVLDRLILRALSNAKVELSGIDAIAAAGGPGLIGGVLVGLTAARDVISFFGFWEVMSSWALWAAIVHEETPVARREGFKYFFFNTVGASFMFLGLVVLSTAAGTTDLAGIGRATATMPIAALATGLVTVLVGLVMKAAQLPVRIDVQMHPAAAPTPVSGYISAVLLKAGPWGVLKLFVLFGGAAAATRVAGTLVGIPTLMEIVAAIGAITILVAGAQAFVQNGIKLVLIWSTVCQLGYVMMAVALGSSLGVAAGLMHFANHMFLKDTLFLVAGAVMVSTHASMLDELGGLGRKMPITFSIFLLAGLSLAGIPPLNGFASKWMIFEACFGSGHWALGIAAMIGSLFTLAAILKFAEVPLGAGASKPAFAMMGARTQDAIPYAANEVFVAAIKGDRVFVGNIALKEDFTVPACRAARAKTETSIKAMTEAQTGGGKDMSKTIEAAGAKAETDFRVCFAARAAKEPGFAAVVERAQELYALMPAR